MCLTGVWLKCLLSGGTLSLCGQPDRLRWCGYRPVTWPVPSQPGVGHRLSFLSARETSVGRKKKKRNTEVIARDKMPHCSTELEAETESTYMHNETELYIMLRGVHSCISKEQVLWRTLDGNIYVRLSWISWTFQYRPHFSKFWFEHHLRY